MGPKSELESLVDAGLALWACTGVQPELVDDGSVPGSADLALPHPDGRWLVEVTQAVDQQAAGAEAAAGKRSSKILLERADGGWLVSYSAATPVKQVFAGLDAELMRLETGGTWMWHKGDGGRLDDWGVVNATRCRAHGAIAYLNGAVPDDDAVFTGFGPSQSWEANFVQALEAEVTRKATKIRRLGHEESTVALVVNGPTNAIAFGLSALTSSGSVSAPEAPMELDHLIVTSPHVPAVYGWLRCSCATWSTHHAAPRDIAKRWNALNGQWASLVTK